MAERKLDIFRVLNALNKKDAGFFETLSEEEKKEFQPFLVARWMSGTPSAQQVFLINEVSNKYNFSLTNHKQLLWQLLCVSNSGQNQRYTWNKLPGKSTSGKPNAARAVMQYYKYSMKDAIQALKVLSRNDVLEIAQDLGWQQEDIAKIRKEIKADKNDPSDEPSTTTGKGKKTSSKEPDLFEF